MSDKRVLDNEDDDVDAQVAKRAAQVAAHLAAVDAWFDKHADPLVNRVEECIAAPSGWMTSDDRKLRYTRLNLKHDERIGGGHFERHEFKLRVHMLLHDRFAGRRIVFKVKTDDDDHDDDYSDSDSDSDDDEPAVVRLQICMAAETK